MAKQGEIEALLQELEADNAHLHELLEHYRAENEALRDVLEGKEAAQPVEEEDDEEIDALIARLISQQRPNAPVEQVPLELAPVNRPCFYFAHPANGGKFVA